MARPRSLSNLTGYDLTDIPFWFFDEDPFVVKTILLKYEQHLHLSEQNATSRQPPLFVGRIERVPLTGTPFRTLDTVCVCRRKLAPEGATMPIKAVFKFITEWNTDGLPSLISAADTANIVEADNAPISYLYGEPIFNSDGNYHYTASWQQHDVGYAGLFTPCLWQSFPKTYFNCDGEADEEEQYEEEREEERENRLWQRDEYSENSDEEEDNHNQIEEIYLQVVLDNNPLTQNLYGSGWDS